MSGLGLKGVCVLTTALLLSSAVTADTSLWIPDTDPQPLSASVVGVGSDGRTTWQIQQGSATGTFTDPDDLGFLGVTATLIEGPSDAVFSAIVTTTDPTDGGAVTGSLIESCTISGSIAACGDVVTENGVVNTDIDTETVSPFLVQGGGSATNSGPTSTASGSQASGGSTPTSSGGSTPAPSGGSTPASSGAKPTGTGKNSAQRHHIAGGAMALVVGSVFASFS